MHTQVFKHDIELVRLVDLRDRHEVLRHTWDIQHVDSLTITYLTYCQKNTFVHSIDTDDLCLGANRYNQIAMVALVQGQFAVNTSLVKNDMPIVREVAVLEVSAGYQPS
jgi:hypothetical protein